MAGLVKKSIRKSDHFGRWGGEEFLIILPNTTFSDADRIMHHLKDKIAGFDFGLSRSVTVSMGIGQFQNKEKLTPFLNRVDNCLYKAKDQGRNRIVTAEAE